MVSTAKVMMGWFQARMRSAPQKSWNTSPEAFWNFLFSYSSRTKLLTTRMPVTFSSTLSLRASYFLKMRRKMGMTVRAMLMRAKPSRKPTMT